MFYEEIPVLNLIGFYIICFCIKAYAQEDYLKQVVTIQHSNKHICTGSILKPDIILTSAYFFTDQNKYIDDIESIKVVAGVMERIIKDDSIKAYHVKSILVHPRFKYREDNSDLALIFLNESIPAQTYGSTVTLATKRPEEFSTCLLVGWNQLFPDGPTGNQIITMKLNVGGSESCSIYPFYNHGLICLDPPRRAAEQGPRGGMLLCDGKQSGIGLFRFLGGFQLYVTDVAFYRDWIMQNNALKFGARFLLSFSTVFISFVL